MSTRRFVERNRIFNLAAPQDAGSGGIVSDFASLRNYMGATLWVSAGLLPQTTTLQIRQAKNVAGGEQKHLAIATYYTNLSTSSPDDEKDVWHEVTGGTGVVALAAQTQYVFDIKPAALDVQNGFDSVGIEIDDPGAGVNFVAAMLILHDGPYGITGDNRHQPSAAVNRSVN